MLAPIDLVYSWRWLLARTTLALMMLMMMDTRSPVPHSVELALLIASSMHMIYLAWRVGADGRPDRPGMAVKAFGLIAPRTLY